MKRSQVVIVSAIATVLLLAFNEAAVSLRLYWSLWWLDIVMHFLGGLIVGSVAVSVLVRRKDSFMKMVLVVTLATLVVALAWEAYEFFAQAYYARDYVVDTLADIMLGLAGGLTMSIVAHRILTRDKKKNK